MKLTRILLIVPLLALWCGGASAQYYDWGQEPMRTRWLQAEGDNGRVVFPESYREQALRMMEYVDLTMPHSGFGFRHGAMRMPLLTHAHNLSPNGLVMLAPNRIELIVAPPASTYATPWIKQLVAHELRHSVQFNNLNKGVIGALGKIFGQHGSAIGLAFMPYWAMEGDAVLAETQMTAFGRALQPSFTIAYRALLMEGDWEKYPADKFFCGSYLDYLPDHYHLGYQITAYADTKYGENIWDKVVDYGSRRPYQLFTAHIALKKYYGTSTTKLLWETLDDLAAYWRSRPLADNSTRIVESPISSHTTYSTPVDAGNGRIYSLKKDLDRTGRIVLTDPATGRERTLHRTGSINTGLVLSGGRLWWTELRQSALWQQRVNSELCWYDPATGKSGREKTSGRVTFPTPTPEGAPAYVEYEYTGSYAIAHGQQRYSLPDTMSVHGLAMDRGKFYLIGLSDCGMGIYSVDAGSGMLASVTPAGRTTLSSLRAADGRLYYNSIASGMDEAWSYDIASGRQRQITSSRYGSFDPAPTQDGRVLVTTYTPQGYRLAVQEDATGTEAGFAYMPANVVNPPRMEWDVPCVDSFRIENAGGDEKKTKRFRKAMNQFRFHSWAPAYYEPDNMLGETNLNVNLGVTLLSQNMLNSTVTSLGYKYTEEGHFLAGKIKLNGLAPKFEVEAEYGSMDQLVYVPRKLQEGEVDFSTLDRGNYFSMTARAYLPITFDAGHRYRRLTPQVEFEHENSKLYYPYDEQSGRFRNGMQKMKFSLLFTDNVLMAHRDLTPRWGYALRLTYTSNPFSDRFGEVWSGYARAYLPGIGAHHSLMLRTGLQAQELSTYNYRQKEVFPRGARFDFTPSRYGSLAVDYQLPLWHPEGGIRSLLYFRRVRLNLCYDYARHKTAGIWDDIHSYGAELTFDIVPFRLPASTATAFTINVHKATNRSGVVVGASFVMPL